MTAATPIFCLLLYYLGAVSEQVRALPATRRCR